MRRRDEEAGVWEGRTRKREAGMMTMRVVCWWVRWCGGGVRVNTNRLDPSFICPSAIRIIASLVCLGLGPPAREDDQEGTNKQ